VSDVRAKLEGLLGTAGVAASAPGAPPIACPASDEEVAETIRLAARERWKLLPCGFGTDPAGDLRLSTRRLAGVVAYEPGDGTLSARAGTSMAELERVAREGGNHLTPRVAAPERSTLGGVLASGRSGIDRLRYGPARHHVLGMRVALADGTLARSGGRLVKNVTGYDMHRLWCGSRGSLCVVLEATLRLFAGFEREVLVTVPARDRASATATALAAEALGVQPLGILAEDVLDPGGAWRVHVLLAGRAGLVEWGRRRVLEGLPGAVEGAELIERLRDAELLPGARLAVEPSIGLSWISREGGAPAPRAPGPAAALCERLKRTFDPEGLFAAGVPATSS